MSLELIPSNDLVSEVGVFGQTHTLNHANVTPEQLTAATRYLDRHAPDLRSMILGRAA